MKEEHIKLLNSMINSKKIDYLLLADLMPYCLKIWQNETIRFNMQTVFDRDDGISIIYIAYKETINEFINYKLDPCLFFCKFVVRVRTKSLNFIRSHKKVADHILNSNFHYPNDENKQNDIIEYNYQLSHYLDCIYDILKKDIHKTIIKMKIDGYSNIEISKKLNIPTKTVENNIFLIRKKLEKSNIKSIFFK